MSTKQKNISVTIAGGGLAGLSAAVFLSEKGYSVNLLESSPKLGGRAYSFYYEAFNQKIDNGQHLLAGWYQNTFDYLKIIGTYGSLDFQKSLNVDFLTSGKNHYKFALAQLHQPFNILAAIWKFKGFNIREKIKSAGLYKIARLMRLPENKLNEFNVKEILEYAGQRGNIEKYFWNPFLLSVFNTKPENISGLSFARLLKAGFSEKRSSVLVFPRTDLSSLFIGESYFERANINIKTGCIIKKIHIENDLVKFVETAKGEKIISDYYISAVPYFAFKKLFKDEDFKEYFSASTGNLKTSGIISVYLQTKDEIPQKINDLSENNMVNLTDGVFQWVFVKSKNLLSLTISGADDIEEIRGLSNEDLIRICLGDLNKHIPDFEKINIANYKVIREKRATFIPDSLSDISRPESKTGINNFFIAGDWTKTGLPATIESAIKSGRICSELVYENN